MANATLRATDGAQFSIIGFIQTLVTIGNISILTIFIIIKEMFYKIILREL